MTYKAIFNRLAAAARRAYSKARKRSVRRRCSCDVSRLSDHMLRDIGVMRDGDWVGFEIKF